MKGKFSYTLPIAALVISSLAFLLLSYLSCGKINQLASAFAQEGEPVILLDPGHGGEDGGTQSEAGLLEKDVNLAVALHLRELLETAGYQVKMTRETDCSIGDSSLPTVRERKVSDIHRRLEMVEEEANCILVSIHQNYFTEGKYSGAQIFFSPNHEESEILAESIRSSVVSLLQPENTRQNKAATDSIYLLWNAEVPAVLVECGFLSNWEEAERLADSTYQEQMAFAIYDGLLRYLSGAAGSRA